MNQSIIIIDSELASLQKKIGIWVCNSIYIVIMIKLKEINLDYIIWIEYWMKNDRTYMIYERSYELYINKELYLESRQHVSVYHLNILVLKQIILISPMCLVLSEYCCE
jgi:hypothetical protein